MKTSDIKRRIAYLSSVALPAVAVRTIPSKRPNPWIEVRIRPLPSSVFSELLYPAQIPAWVRQIALAVVYGPDSQLTNQTEGGNVRAHSLSMHESEWGRFLETLDAVVSCGTTPGNELEVARSYLRHRISPVV